jgi:hypothetical protein
VVVTASFDRVRPRTGTGRVGSALQDAEGKRALFSSAPVEQPVSPAPGAVTIECSRCGAERVLSPVAAMRALVPSVPMSLRFGFGRQETRLGLGRSGVFLRCPACRRGAWSQVTIRL